MKQRVIVTCLIKKSNEYLFIKQNKPGGAYPDCYHLPGGGVDAGEDLNNAMRREIKEEANIEVKNLKRFQFDYDNLDNYKGEPYQLIFLQYIADYASGNPKPGDDAKEIIWVKKDELNQAPLNPATLKFLQEIHSTEKSVLSQN
jgi:nucleoside triphosphatase